MTAGWILQWFPLWSLLAPGQVLLHQDVFLSHEPGLWIGQEYSSFQNDGRIFRLLSRTGARFGVREDLEIGAHVDYQRARLASGQDAGRRDGDTLAGVSEVGLRAEYRIFPSVTARLGYRNSGDNSLSGDDLLAINDGSAKFDLGARFELPWAIAETSYTLRTDPRGDRLLFSVEVPISGISEGLVLAPRLDYLHTLTGFDIASENWIATATSLGTNPFTQTRERFLSLGLQAAQSIDDRWLVKGSLSFKAWGQNSHKSFEGRLGVSVLL